MRQKGRHTYSTLSYLQFASPFRSDNQNMALLVERKDEVAHEQEVLGVMEALRIADKHIVGEVMAVKVGWKPGVSATNNAYKALLGLAELGKVEKGSGYFRMPGCKSDYGVHAKLLSRILAEILKLPFGSTIIREHIIPETGLRPDALVLLIQENRALCMVLEVVSHETEQSLQTKRNTWNAWPEACRYLGQLFGTSIAHFDFVRSDEFNSYLKEVVHENRTHHLRDLSIHAGAGDLRQAVT